MRKLFLPFLPLALLMPLSACNFDVSDDATLEPPALPEEQEESAANADIQPDTPLVNTREPLTITCADSDQGDDYFTKGTVDVSEPITLKEGAVAQILSTTTARMRIGNEMRDVIAGGAYPSSGPDQVSYLKPDTTNGSVLIDMPATFVVHSVDFIGIGNPENGITVIHQVQATDQCSGNVLIENSCVRGINTGYLCPNGCAEGACIQ